MTQLEDWEVKELDDASNGIISEYLEEKLWSDETLSDHEKQIEMLYLSHIEDLLDSMW